MTDLIDRAALIADLDRRTAWPKGWGDVRGIIDNQPAAPSSALTREALAAALHETGWRNHNLGEGPARAICDSIESHLYRADAILSALGTPPPAGVFVTEADLYYDGKGPDGGIRTREDLGGLVRARFAALSKISPPTEEAK